MKHIPNIITSLNIVSGFTALIFAANGHLVTASWLILAAMVFDFADGLSARILKAYSEVGKELDSLADLVSFGVAPAFIIYRLLAESRPLFDGNGLAVSGGISAFIPVIMVVCAALRLAIFNLDTSQKTSFKGLPTPANALAVITVIIASSLTDSKILQSFTGSQASLIAYTIILSVLMVSRLPLLSLKSTSLRLKGNEPRYLLVTLVLSSLIVFGPAAAPLIIPLYILVSLGSALILKA